uniref:Golgi integral membrane protein 4 n=1 Tax=Lygus hesperus TaxID=30085 RepID=A0A0A9Y7Z8_LYGHE
MSSSRLVRGAKTRMFAFVCLISVLGAVLYVFHGTQNRLAEVQSQATQCNQQKESFNAQLQVIYEYKDRLEKSLNKEKQDRKLDKENHERDLAEAKEKWEKETLELNNKYDALVQKSKILQAQLEDQKEISDKAVSKLQSDNNNLEAALADAKKELEESQNKFKGDTVDLKNKFLEHQEELKNCKREVEDFRMKSAPAEEQKDYLTKQNEQLKSERERLQGEVSDCKNKLLLASKIPSSSPKIDRADLPEANVVDMPKLMGMKNFSSTPGINPDAVGESSSMKPVSNQGEPKKEEQVGLAPKKPTQNSEESVDWYMYNGVNVTIKHSGEDLVYWYNETSAKKKEKESVIPLEQPKKFDDNPPPAGQAQIPGPPDSNPDVLNKPVVEEPNDLSNINMEEGDDQHLAESKAQLNNLSSSTRRSTPTEAKKKMNLSPNTIWIPTFNNSL